MLKLYQFTPKYGLPNVGPFCMKVETFLRMAKISYTPMLIDDPRKGPKGKIPYVDDDGQVIADSAFIIEHLTKKHNVTLDRDLSSYQKGVSRMITGALEERLYFAMVYSRWVDDENWPAIKETWFSAMPPVIRTIAPIFARKDITKSLHGHGLGRHSAEEIYSIGRQDLQGLVDLIGDQKFTLGDKPTTVDATVFAMVAGLMYVTLDSPLRDFVNDQPALVDYCQRMGKTFFPEYKVFLP